VFEGCYAATDSYWGAYRLQFTNLHSGTTYILGDFEAAESGNPIWLFDFRTRLDYCQFELKDATATQRKSLFVGSSDGFVRQENVMTNADDDGDSYLKKMTVRTAHRYPEGQGGDEEHAVTFNGLDLYLLHPNQAATISLYAGDDKVAEEAVVPTLTWDSPATAEPTGARQRTTRASERRPIEGVSGKGVTLQVEVSSPVDVEYRGCSLDYVPSGAQDRAFTE